MSGSSFEFQVESFISSKELNHQSVSLVIPRLTRDKIHNMIYYKVNLNSVSLRGDTLIELSKILIRDLGTLKGTSVNVVHMLGGVEFKCLLMKLVEIRPTVDQIIEFFKVDDEKKDDTKTNLFEDKYIIALFLVYIRIQYYYLRKDDELAIKFRQMFKKYINDYRKLKSLDFEVDCWSQAQNLTVSTKHLDELVDELVTKDQLWGLPLGTCRWCNIYANSDSDSDSDSDATSGSDSE